MSDWSKALAPVIAWAVKITLGIVIAYGFWTFAPDEFKVWAFGLLDKYLPTVADFFK